MEHEPCAAVLTVTGELDVATAYDFYPKTAKQAEDGHRVVIADLAGVTFVDSTGLSMLIRADDELKYNPESRLLLRNPSAPLTRLLEVTGLTAHFEHE